MTEEEIIRDNRLRTARSEVSHNSQRNFNLYVDTMAFAYKTTPDVVCQMSVVKEYGDELGVKYTGDGKW